MAGLTHASPTVEIAVPLEGRQRRVSPGFEAWRKFRRHRMAVVSVVMFAVLTSAVVLGPFVWRLPINEIDFTARLSAPSWQHPLGTDDLGQDLLARMLYGGRISLAVGFAAMAVAIIAGTVIGAISGISRGSIDAVLMWITDLFLSLPQLPLLLLYRVRPGDRRLSLDAGGAPGPRPVPVVAREGIRRSGAGARRHHAASGHQAYPAEFARTGHRRRYHRRRSGDYRGIDAVVPRPRLSVRHSDLGAPVVRCKGLSRHRTALGAVRRRRHFPDRACHQFHRRRIARRARSP